MVETVRTIQETQIPAWLRSYQEDILARAKALSRDDLVRPAFTVAERTPLQEQASELAAQGVGAYMPMLQAGAGTVGTGVGALTEGLGYARRAAPLFEQGAEMMRGSAQAYDPSSYQAFMDPYTEEVIRRTEEDIARQGQIQAQDIASAAVGQGAFGGSRQAVAERELGRAIQDQQADMAAQLRSQGFQQAQTGAQSAFENQQRRQMGAGQGLGQLGSQFGTMARGIGSLGQGLTSAGLRQAQLGEAYQGLNINDINLLSQMGMREQAQRQAELDASRQTQVERMMQPYQQLGFYSDIYQGMPSTQTSLTQTQQPSPSTLSQLGGLGMGLYSLSQYNQ